MQTIQNFVQELKKYLRNSEAFPIFSETFWEKQ